MKLLFLILPLVVMICNDTIAINCNEKPPRIDIKSCCPMPELISSAMANMCKNRYNETLQMNHENSTESNPSNLGPCYMECVFHETGIMQDEAIHLDKANIHLGQTLKGQSGIQTVAVQAFATCAERVKASRERKISVNNAAPEPPATNSNCKPSAMVFMNCVHHEIFMNCPHSNWTNDDACNRNREFIKICENPKESSMQNQNENEHDHLMR